MYKFPSAKGFRRRTRLEQAAARIEFLDARSMGTINILSAYSNPKNWRLTGETRDVKNEAGLVVGVEQIHAWIGPSNGPELAAHALKQILDGPVEKESK